MKSIAILAFAATLAAVPFTFAADAAQHDEHHPATPAAKPAPDQAAKAKTTPKAADQQMEKMDAQMKAMHEMHEKMMAVKTPEERKALMGEHMKTMQAGMSTMNSMMMGDKVANSAPMSLPKMQKQMAMMQKQMAMMQMMMQMMMDQIATDNPDEKKS